MSAAKIIGPYSVGSLTQEYSLLDRMFGAGNHQTIKQALMRDASGAAYDQLYLLSNQKPYIVWFRTPWMDTSVSVKPAGQAIDPTTSGLIPAAVAFGILGLLVYFSVSGSKIMEEDRRVRDRRHGVRVRAHATNEGRYY